MSDAVSVLIIDDNHLDRELMTIILNTGPYVIQTCIDEQQVFQQISTNPPPDIVIAEITFAGNKGLSIINKIRAEHNWQDVPIIAIASEMEQQTVISLKNSGANAIISKPYSPERLQAEVLKLTGYERVGI